MGRATPFPFLFSQNCRHARLLPSCLKNSQRILYSLFQKGLTLRLYCSFSVANRLLPQGEKHESSRRILPGRSWAGCLLLFSHPSLSRRRFLCCSRSCPWFWCWRSSAVFPLGRIAEGGATTRAEEWAWFS